MRPILVALVPLWLFASACVSDAPTAPSAAPAAAAIVPALAPASAPGAEHRALDVLAGAWSIELFATGGAAPIARGSARIEWCFEGRFLCWEARFDLGGAGSPSSGFLGYDSFANEYQWVWLSGWTGRASLARGRGELGDGLRLVSEEIDPASGALARVRSVLTMRGPDELEIVQDVEAAPGVWRPTTRTAYLRVTEAGANVGDSSGAGRSQLGERP